MKRHIPLTIIAIGLIALQSCQYDWVQEEPEVPITDTLSFATDIQPIFNLSCNGSGCHAKGGFDPDLTAENSYSALFAENLINTADPESSGLYLSVIKGGSMESFAKSGDANKILTWIQQGALNN
jgi:hypothetical protein